MYNDIGSAFSRRLSDMLDKLEEFAKTEDELALVDNLRETAESARAIEIYPADTSIPCVKCGYIWERG